MVLDNLSSSLREALKKIANAPRIDKEIISEVLKEIQRALLRADVNVKLVLKITKEVERRALTEKPPPGTNSREHVIRIIYEELVKILGKERDVPLKRQRIMMVGLYGQGKTTTAGKLAKYFQKKGMKCALIAGDVHRPAAYDQLLQIGEKVNVPVYGERGAKNATEVVRKGLEKFRDYDIIIIDTAGRHSLEKDLIEEMERISKVVNPDEIFLVLDATVGQQAGPQAKAFHDAVGITGVIVTKLDGSAKGGGALSAVAETGAPIVFIGVGEHPDDLEKFDPPRFISRILGMGDLQSLLERAREVVDEDKAEEVARKIITGKFTLIEMREQMEMLTKMGPLKKIMSLFPSFGGRFNPMAMEGESLEETQRKLKTFKVIMNSMTEEELKNPRIIKSSRIKRISRGAGVTTKDVKELLNYYNKMLKTMKSIQGNRRMRKQLMKQLRIEGLDEL